MAAVEDIKEIKNEYKYASYIVSLLAIVSFGIGIVSLIQVNNGLSNLYDNMVTNKNTTDNISVLLGAYSMQLTIAISFASFAGVLMGASSWLYSSWVSINSMNLYVKTSSSFIMGILKAIQIIDTKLDDLNTKMGKT